MPGSEPPQPALHQFTLFLEKFGDAAFTDARLIRTAIKTLSSVLTPTEWSMPLADLIASLPKIGQRLAGTKEGLQAATIQSYVSRARGAMTLYLNLFGNEPGLVREFAPPLTTPLATSTMGVTGAATDWGFANRVAQHLRPARQPEPLSTSTTIATGPGVFNPAIWTSGPAKSGAVRFSFPETFTTEGRLAGTVQVTGRIERAPDVETEIAEALASLSRWTHLRDYLLPALMTAIADLSEHAQAKKGEDK